MKYYSQIVWNSCGASTFSIWRASPAIAPQYVTLLQKNFSHPSFSYILFCNPTHWTELGSANKLGGLLIANHLDELLWWADQRNTTEQVVWLDHICLLSGFFCRYVHHKLSCNDAERAQCPLLSRAKLAHFDFSSSNLLLCAGSHTKHHWRRKMLSDSAIWEC
jgi:hypothetical protein